MRTVRIPLWRIWTGNRVRRPARRPQWRRNVWRAWSPKKYYLWDMLGRAHRIFSLRRMAAS